VIPKLISVTGPESTGKSQLSRDLAEELNLGWVPEVARRYLSELQRAYNRSDLFNILQQQLHLEQETLKHYPQGLVTDTDPLVIQIWSAFKFGSVDPKIVSTVQQHRYDHYLVLDVDLPWEPDPLREHPNQREELLNLYLNQCVKSQFPHTLISGIGPKRLANAHRAVRHLFDD